MTIPFVRRRLVFSIENVPSAPAVHRALRFPALEGASDSELARLHGGPDSALDRTRWETMLVLHGFRAY